MEYNKSFSNEYDTDKYIEIFKKKNDNFKCDIETFDKNLFIVIDNLQNKVKELETKIEFCKKYHNKPDNDIHNKLKDTIYMVEQVINKLDKNIIGKAQIGNDKKHNFIELEF